METPPVQLKGMFSKKTCIADYSKVNGIYDSIGNRSGKSKVSNFSKKFHYM